MTVHATSCVEENQRAWNQVYAGSPRLQYPDLMFIHLLKCYLPWRECQRGLCVGSGDGAQPLAAAALGIDMECIDLSEESVARLRQFSRDDDLESRISVGQGEQTDLSRFDDNTFDFAISWSVLSYGFPETAMQGINEIYRVVKPGGGFIGLLESDNHTAYSQEGVVQLAQKTYQMPKNPAQSKEGVIMTFYDREEVGQMLSSFTQVSLSHRVIQLPPDCVRSVGQWMFYAQK